MRWQSWADFQKLLHTEFLHLTTVHASNRRWQMPFAAALSSGLPLLIGVFFGHLDYGLVSSLGGLVFLYLPETPLHHRLALLMACAFSMVACYTLGVMSHFFPALMVLALTFIAIVVTMACRFYRIGPPGSLFFVMAASIGAFSPVEVMQVPLLVGLFVMGSLLAFLIAFFYSLYILRLQPPQPAAPLPAATFEFVVFDSVVIGVFVGITLVLAGLLQLERAYWAPVSCLAVIQGMSLRAVWIKQIQRIIGTGVGLLLSWGLLALPLNQLGIALVMTALSFVIETLVVRHYGLAVIFVTPLTVFLAEAASIGHGTANAMIQARFFDTVLGAVVGLIGGWCLHSPGFREVVGRHLKRLTPTRLIP